MRDARSPIDGILSPFGGGGGGGVSPEASATIYTRGDETILDRAGTTIERRAV